MQLNVLYYVKKRGGGNVMILSLQGCMAVGKTTVARYLEQHCQQVQVCFEDNAAVLAEIKRRGLNKNCYADYLEIQRLFFAQ